MIPNFQFSLSSALPVITRADLWPSLEEDSISLVFSRLPVGDGDFSVEPTRTRVERQRWTFSTPPAKYRSLQSAVAHWISFMGSKGKFLGANMRPWITQSSQWLLLCMWNKSYNNGTFLASRTCVRLCIWTMLSSLVVTVCHCSGTLHNIRRGGSDENQFSKDWFFPPLIFDVSATLNAISLDIKWNKPSTCCSFNSCVGNREMEMSAARFTARGQEKKWLLYCLWLKDCFKYIILSFRKSSISILERNNTFNVCKDTFTVWFF